MPAASKYILVALLCAALLVWRIDVLLRQEAAWTLPRYADTTAVVVGTVVDDPDVRDTSVRVDISVATINGEPGSGKLLAALPVSLSQGGPPGTAVAYGDTIEVRGLVELPQAFETQSGRLFDYPGYLRVRGVSAVMQRAQLFSPSGVEGRSDAPGGLSLMGSLFTLKHALEQALRSILPAPQLELLRGILLGQRGGIGADVLQLFALVGFIHIVVLSGTHVSIVSEGIFRTLSFLPRRAVYVAGGTAVLLFVLMTGAGAASVRALIMGLIAIVARFMRRPRLALRSLGAAGVLMVLWNPLVALNSSFILSVLASFGLITIAPAIERHMRLVPAWKKFNLRSLVATTLSVELFILPALLYFSGVLSIVALPVNVLLLPLVPIIIYAGFITGLLAVFSPALALLPALVTDVLLRLMLFVVVVAANLPLSHIIIPTFPAWVAVLAYVPLTIFAWRVYTLQESTRLKGGTRR